MNSKDKEIMTQFGKRLAEVRKQKGLSLRELGALADMDYGNINEIEKAKINPTLTTIVLLAEALQVEVGYLFLDK